MFFKFFRVIHIRCSHHCEKDLLKRIQNNSQLKSLRELLRLISSKWFAWFSTRHHWQLGHYISLAKSVRVLSKKFASFTRRKLLCKLKVSNYQCTRKIALKNKIGYIPSIIIIYHCYQRITLLLFFTYHPTYTPRVFHVETTWKRSFPSRFNVEYTWFVRRADA